MNFCKYCGRELEDGEVCNCTDPKQNTKSVVIDSEGKKPKKRKEKKKLNFKNIAIFAGIIVGIAAIVIIILLIISAVNAYKKPVKNLFKGVNKPDVEIVMESLYPEETMTVKKVSVRDSGVLWKDYIKEKNNSVGATLDNMGLKKAKYEIVDAEEVSGSDMLDKIKDYYKNKYELEVKKVYRIKVDVTFKFKSNGGEQNFTDMLYVAKLKGEGWKFYPEDYNKTNLDYINVIVNAASE